MGFALSRDLFYFGFFVAAAEFRLSFGRCYIRFRDVFTLNNIDRNQRSLGRPQAAPFNAMQLSLLQIKHLFSDINWKRQY